MEEDEKVIENNVENNVEKKDAKAVTVKVLRVIIPKDSYGRLTLVTNGEFKAVNPQTGDEIVTANVTKNLFEMTNQLAQHVTEIQLAQAMALGQAVNPMIISLAMANAEIKVKHVFHEQGEERAYDKGVYASDCYVAEIIGVTTHIAPQFAAMLQTLIMTQPAANAEQKSAAIPNFLAV